MSDSYAEFYNQNTKGTLTIIQIKKKTLFNLTNLLIRKFKKETTSRIVKQAVSR